MRPKKPLSEFTLDTLLGCKKTLENLIIYTQELIDQIHILKDTSPPAIEIMDRIAKENKSPVEFMELARINLESFKLNYQLILDELTKRTQ